MPNPYEVEASHPWLAKMRGWFEAAGLKPEKVYMALIRQDSTGNTYMSTAWQFEQEVTPRMEEQFCPKFKDERRDGFGLLGRGNVVTYVELSYQDLESFKDIIGQIEDSTGSKKLCVW